MTRFIACYDLKETRPDPHSEFISQAEARGWSTWIWGPKSEKWLKLPNTTLIGDFSNSQAAIDSFNAAVTATGAAIGRAVDVEKSLIATYDAKQYNSDVRKSR